MDRYRKLFDAIERERPAGVFLGGDLLPSGFGLAGAEHGVEDFVADVLVREFSRLAEDLGHDYPAVFLILGNDDPRVEEARLVEHAGRGLWQYAHGRRLPWSSFDICGYSCIPPTPFRLKDWERYDVSRFVDPGCSSPEEGWRTVAADEHEVQYGTIQKDLDLLAADAAFERAILLFHCPPYKGSLDRAALDGVMVDYAPVDVHVGSIAVRRFIERRQPLVTLHGHVHESARLTGEWRERIGRTHAFSAAHDGSELALVRFDPEDLDAATRELL